MFLVLLYIFGASVRLKQCFHLISSRYDGPVQEYEEANTDRKTSGWFMLCALFFMSLHFDLDHVIHVAVQAENFTRHLYENSSLCIQTHKHKTQMQ